MDRLYHKKRYNRKSYVFHPLDDDLYEGYSLECPSDKHKFYSLYDVKNDVLTLHCCYRLGGSKETTEIWDMSTIKGHLVFKLRRDSRSFPCILAVETSDEMADHMVNGDLDYVNAFKTDIVNRYKELDYKCKLHETAVLNAHNKAQASKYKFGRVLAIGIVVILLLGIVIELIYNRHEFLSELKWALVVPCFFLIMIIFGGHGTPTEINSGDYVNAEHNGHIISGIAVKNWDGSIRVYPSNYDQHTTDEEKSEGILYYPEESYKIRN